MIKKKFYGCMKGKILLYNKSTEQKKSLETILEEEELNLLIESTEPLIQCHVDRIGDAGTVFPGDNVTCIWTLIAFLGFMQINKNKSPVRFPINNDE